MCVAADGDRSTRIGGNRHEYSSKAFDDAFPDIRISFSWLFTPGSSQSGRTNRIDSGHIPRPHRRPEHAISPLSFNLARNVWRATPRLLFLGLEALPGAAMKNIRHNASSASRFSLASRLPGTEQLASGP